jgi:hypothetical protein
MPEMPDPIIEPTFAKGFPHPQGHGLLLAIRFFRRRHLRAGKSCDSSFKPKSVR